MSRSRAKPADPRATASPATPNQRAPPAAARSSTTTTSTPKGSYLVRVLELREVRVRTVFELRDIASGESLRFDSAAAMQRWLAGRH